MALSYTEANFVTEGVILKRSSSVTTSLVVSITFVCVSVRHLFQFHSDGILSCSLFHIVNFNCKIFMFIFSLYRAVWKTMYVFTVKVLLSPRGAYLISDLPEGGLNRKGAY